VLVGLGSPGEHPGHVQFIDDQSRFRSRLSPQAFAGLKRPETTALRAGNYVIGQHGETTALTEITAHDRDPLQDLVPNESLTLFLFQNYGSLNRQVGVENIAYLLSTSFTGIISTAPAKKSSKSGARGLLGRS